MGLVLREYLQIFIFSLLADRIIKIFKCIRRAFFFCLRSRYAKNLRKIAPVEKMCRVLISGDFRTLRIKKMSFI